MTKKPIRKGLIFMISAMTLSVGSAAYAYFDRLNTQQVCLDVLLMDSYSENARWTIA